MRIIQSGNGRVSANYWRVLTNGQFERMQNNRVSPIRLTDQEKKGIYANGHELDALDFFAFEDHGIIYICDGITGGCFASGYSMQEARQNLLVCFMSLQEANNAQFLGKLLMNAITRFGISPRYGGKGPQIN